MQSLKFLPLLLLFQLIFHAVDAANITLCSDALDIWPANTLRPRVVVLREKNSNNRMLNEAMSDVSCWVDRVFSVSRSVSVPTESDRNNLCFRISTESIKSTETMIVITEGHTMSECLPAIYGPIPNILNIRVFVDVHSDVIYKKRLELSLRNTGGRLGVHFELHRSNSVERLRSTLRFMMGLGKLTPLYGKLVPWWSPEILLPPDDLQYRAAREETDRLTQTHYSISPVLILSCMPMLIFGIVVSFYLVIHPRGGLTLVDEEIDFVIHEVESQNNIITALEKSVHRNTHTNSSIDNDPSIRAVRKPVKKPSAETAVVEDPPPVPADRVKPPKELIKTDETPPSSHLELHTPLSSTPQQPEKEQH